MDLKEELEDVPVRGLFRIEDDLDRLRQGFDARRIPRTPFQAIHGLGGVGKTQLAIEYAYRFAADYDAVWWVRAEEPATLAADFADLAVKVDANRRAINALGEQTRERFDRLEGRFDRLEGRFDRLEGRVGALETKVDEGFAAMRHGFDQTAAGFARIAELITARDEGP